MNIYDVINNKEKFNITAIYLWRNLVNQKVYVGQAQNLYQRMRQYLRGNDKDRVIGRALAKYGFDNFDLSLLEEKIPLESLDGFEQRWMDFYESYNPEKGYNVCKEAGTTRGFKHSERSKQKMRDGRRAFISEHPDFMRGENNPMYGKHLSQEHRNKIGEKSKGNQYAKGCTWKMSDETKTKISKALKGKQNCLGRKLSQETKDKIAEANRRRTITDETRRKQSESHMGKTVKMVICLDTGVVYSSMKEAEEQTGVPSNAISHCCRGATKTAHGMRWAYYIDDDIHV